MSKKDFDELVEKVIKQRFSLASMRPVVEKEILHYDIFKALSSERLLDSLVFQGGTSLRLCRGASRFSEDLDFVGGKDFTSESMLKIKKCIEEHIGDRYGLAVYVKEPKAGEKFGSVNVDRWMVTVQTQSENPSLPSQKIKIEIANTVAYTCEPVALKVNYDFLEYQDEIVVPTESLSEVLADKVVAFPRSLFEKNGTDALAPSRIIRHRDIWDISWLLRNGATLNPKFVNDKVHNDYGVANFKFLLQNAAKRLPAIAASKEFMDQMDRFIDAETLKVTIKTSNFMRQMEADVISAISGMEPHLTAGVSKVRGKEILLGTSP